jgi:hypothetical protein
MKKLGRITTLLLALMTVLMMSQAAFAETYNGGTFSFDGSDIINSDAESTIDEEIGNLEPGDSMTFKFEYSNDSDEDTEWYLENKIVKTLEEMGGTNGGYTYKLVNYGKAEGTVTIFDSEAVAGEDSENPDSEDEGLKSATNATEDWLYIDTLKPGQSGSTELTVALDGESQANSYQATDGQLRIAYAVETLEGETIYKHVPGKRVNTGDMTNLMTPLAMFLGAALLAVLTILSFRKDRKDGDEA